MVATTRATTTTTKHKNKNKKCVQNAVELCFAIAANELIIAVLEASKKFLLFVSDLNGVCVRAVRDGARVCSAEAKLD